MQWPYSIQHTGIGLSPGAPLRVELGMQMATAGLPNAGYMFCLGHSSSIPHGEGPPQKSSYASSTYQFPGFVALTPGLVSSLLVLNARVILEQWLILWFW